MKKETLEKLENNMVALIIGFILAYIIGSFVFGYELERGFLSI